MMLLDPAARPTVDQVHATLMTLGSGTVPATTAPMRGTPTPRPSALRGKGVRLADRGRASAARPADPTGEPLSFRTPGPPPPPPPPPAAAPETESATDTRDSGSAVIAGISKLVGRLITTLEDRRRR
jgi:hypothetical protein